MYAQGRHAPQGPLILGSYLQGHMTCQKIGGRPLEQAFPHKVDKVFYLNGRRSLPVMTASSACERCCQTQTRKPWSALSRSRKFKTELRQQKMK
jgi:hypothetical protein